MKLQQGNDGACKCSSTESSSIISQFLMASRKKDFKVEDVRKALLWCARHCCLCEKQCGVGIELAHIEQNGPNDLRNGIPVCFDCHLAIGGYNSLHPRGRKLRPDELKVRRDQIPGVSYEITQEVRRRGSVVGTRSLPDVGFFIEHRSGPFPVKARVRVTLAQGLKILGPASRHGHYDKTFAWNLNPGFGVNGHFKLPRRVMRNRRSPARARIDVTLIDIYGREHALLPLGYVHRLGKSDKWYLEPSEDALAIPVPRGIRKRRQLPERKVK